MNKTSEMSNCGRCDLGGRTFTHDSSRGAGTRVRLEHALRSLIKTRDYDSITIGEICAAAGVGRSTFYVHYSSKDDLKRAGLEHLRHALGDRQQEALRRSPEPGAALSFSLPMFEHARSHADLYRALIDTRGGSVALTRIRQILSESIRHEIEESAIELGAEDIPREFAVEFVVGAFMAVMTRWLERGARRSPEDMDRMFRRLIMEGLQRARPR